MVSDHDGLSCPQLRLCPHSCDEGLIVKDYDAVGSGGGLQRGVAANQQVQQSPVAVAHSNEGHAGCRQVSATATEDLAEGVMEILMAREHVAGEAAQDV